MALSNRSHSLITPRCLALLLATTALAAGPAAAVVYNVTDEASLIAAINSANASAGADTITFSNAIALTGTLPTITDITTIDTGAFALTAPSVDVFTFSGNGSVQLAGGGAISGGRSIVVSGTSSVTVDNAAGGSISGSSAALQSTGTGTTTITNAGDITGGIGSTGNGDLNITNAASGNIVRVVFGSAIDLSNGGTLTLNNAGDVVGSGWGVVGRDGADSITNSGRIASGTISGNTITVSGNNAIEFQAGGTVTNLAGGQILGRSNGITGGAVVVDNRAGASISGINGVSLGGAAQVTNAGSITGSTGQFERGVNFTGSGATLTNLAGGTITGGRAVSATGSTTIVNAGTITSNCAAPSFQCGAVIMFNGGTVTNASTGQIITTSRGIAGQGSATTVINNGSIVSSLANDTAIILFAGGSITNNAGATVANANGYGAYIFGTAGSITNAGSITGQFGASIDSTSGTISNSGTIDGTNTGVSGFNATLGLANSGQVSGTQFAVRSTNGALSVTNLNGGSISSTNGAGVHTDAGSLTVDNQAGASISAGGHAIRSAGPATITNAGTITSTNADAIWTGNTLSLTNSGTITGGFAGISATAGGSIVNSGTINGSASASGFSYAVQLSGTGSITNQSGGSLGGADGAIALFGNGAINIDLQAGSTTGAIVSTGDGSRSLLVNGALGGSYASTGAGVDTLTLGAGGSMAGAMLGAGDDLFTTQGGIIGGPLDGGDGSDRFTADFATGVSTSFDLAGLTAFETIEKLGLGTLTLGGISASPDALILAGNGGNDDGLLVFDGTSNLTGNIIVNGAIIRADSAGAFGTGTITTIDPTIQYAATGTYSNNIVLAVPGDASLDPTRLEALNSATATLTGSITQDALVGDQYVTIGGNGTIVLTNTANSWADTTTIDSGATLQGASDTISGSSIVDNGTLAFNQSASGTFAAPVSGPGLITVAGLAPGNTLTLSGPLTQIGNNLGTGVASNGLTILDGSRLTLSGGYTGAAIGIAASGATLTNLNTIDTTGASSGFQDGVHSAGFGGTVINGTLGEPTPSTIIGGASGVINYGGTGALAVTNFGRIQGVGYDGVTQHGSGALTVTNNANAIIYGQNSTGSGAGYGVAADGGGALTLTNDAGALIVGRLGVYATGPATITNSGQIASGSLSGSTVTVGGSNAIQLNQGGTVTNLAGGQITGFNTGITGGAIIVDNRSGALISGINAVAIGNGSSVTNAGTITGGTANGNSGVQVGASSTVANLAGGSITGARATQFNGASDVLNNSGSISSTAGTASQGYGALFFSGGTVNNFAGGTIAGSYRGVSIQGTAGTVTNAGTIRSTTEVALLMFNGGTVTNQAGGLIDGQFRGVYIGGAPGTVTNAGTIRATVDNAVSLFAGGAVTNQAGGTLTALGSNAWGIYGTGGALNIDNAGTINADTGIVTNANGAIVTNSGTITGTVDGVNNLAGTSLTLNNNGGTIIATNRTGVRAEGALVLTNSGTIRSNSAATADGVTVFNGAAATITNSGAISAATASGIAVTGVSTITNSGSITGGANANYGYGVQFATGSSGSLVNQSGGTIGGGTGSVLLFTDNMASIDLQQGSTANGAILSTGAGARTVNVAGTLNGVYNAAAGTGNDTVTLAATGSIGGASLGAGDDSITTRGGTIGGAVTGGVGNDVLTFDIAGTTSYNAGLFDGFETRSKIGAGALTLTGTDTMAIDFAVNGGTLILSGGSALNDGAALITAAGTTTRIVGASEQVRTISGAGAIDLGANALILGGNDSSTYSGVISGTGSLAKFGTGILTLSGSNSFTGLTQISGGTLRLGANNVIANASTVLVASGATFDLAGFSDTIGGLTGAGTVALGAGRLTVDQAANTAFSGPITGTGGLTKAGGGLLDLTGASTYTGATFVDGGTLAVNGSLLSAVTVNSGGRLGGNGSVGNLSILSGGILAPGNSIGLLTVNGNLSFATGSIYQVEATPTAADRTNATGNIAIGGGTVQVLASGTAFNPLTRYTILDSVGTVSGTFANVTSNLAFLTPGLEYNPRSVVLVLRRNNINFTDVAETDNQAAVAGAVQSVGISPLYDAVLVQSAGGARAAYDALSGEVYASTQTAIFAQRDRLQDAMASNRLRSDGLSLWLDAGRSWGSFDQSRNRGSAFGSTDTTDLLGGLNWRGGAFAATVAGGRVIDRLEIDTRASDAKTKSWLLGGQVAYGADLGLHAVVGGNYAWHKVATDRTIIFPGFAETASSNRDGRGYHLFGEVGFASTMAGVTLEPFVGLQRDHLRLDAVSETGGLAALDVASASRKLTTAQVGLKLSAAADLGWAKFTPRASVAWQHVMGDRTGQMDAGFQAGGLGYTVTGVSLSRDAAKVGVDLDFDVGKATITAGYNGTLGGVAAQHTAKVALQLRF